MQSNEPNFLKMHYGAEFEVSPKQLAADTHAFVKSVREVAKPKTLAVAPDFGLEIPGWMEELYDPWMEEYLSAKPSMDVFSWHW